MSGNQLLEKLSPPVREAVIAAAVSVDRAHGSALYVQGAPMTEVHFPVAGVFSVILQMEDGDQVESLTVGSEGMIGSAAYLLVTRSPFDTIAQIAGTTLTIPVDALLALTRAHADLDEVLRRYTVFEQRMAHQSAACNALHLVEQRLARWLLMSHDRADGGDTLPLTQEFLAAMLGIRRQSVGQVAHELQRKGLIRYRRGMVVIVDRQALEGHSCECYAAMRAYYQEMFGARPSGQARSEAKRDRSIGHSSRFRTETP